MAPFYSSLQHCCWVGLCPLHAHSLSQLGFE